MSDDGVAEVVRTETARQVVILVFSLVTVVATVGLMSGGMDWRTVKMAFALTAKRKCQREADRWQKWADDAATLYNNEKA